MRPPRLIILLSCFISLLILTILCFPSGRSQQQTSASLETPTTQKNSLSALFTFHTPSSLFPPSAIISLTDDNSTFFLARPAAFGPLLPSKGLSGQLWVGSGFGDDNMRRGGVAEGAEGELGCSDVPGWGEGDNQPGGGAGTDKSSMRHLTNDAATISGKDDKGGKRKRADADGDTEVVVAETEDGTDDHLHHPLSGSKVSKPTSPGQTAQHEPNDKGKHPEHADIQSLQESAEIAGKVVLLSRGGCGFLEKVKWVQRRGGVALIVGDNTRGGGLVTMYARGDTSNVTIASLFTSHTTAHLLSSLIPPGGEVEDMTSLDGGADDRGTSRSSKKKGVKKQRPEDRPTWTQSVGTVKPTSPPRSVKKPSFTQSEAGSGSPFQAKESTGMLRSILSALGHGRGALRESAIGDDSRRPPSSGHIDWVLDDEPGKGRSAGKSKLVPSKGDRAKSENPQNEKPPKSTSLSQSSDDDFVIGVQDWRDPDLVGFKAPDGSSAASSRKSKDRGTGNERRPVNPSPDKSNPGTEGSFAKGNGGLQGGSITPGSGEYESPGNPNKKHSDTPDHDDIGNAKNKVEQTSAQAHTGGGWLSHLLGDSNDREFNDHDLSDDDKGVLSSKKGENPTKEIYHDEDDEDEVVDDDEHEGLWVTLSPTSMSTSPFFDTLLVLVVSPLVTLTVVYALLLLRSRIRRRRWRAPKSVVERLPVRTYHTISGSSSSASSRQATPSAASATSPLLQSIHSPLSSRSRPRSQTTTAVLERPPTPTLDALTEADQPQHEKPPGRRRWYAGKQVECVVCLEEYVDGQSRVMSLPCGHEFHAACITPWLTTRRRTCPICKGDVVRSMAHGNSSSSSASAPTTNRYPSYLDSPPSEVEEDVQPQAIAPTINTPTAAMPIPHSTEAVNSDLERGDDSAATLLEESPNRNRMGWRNLASMSIAAFSGDAAWRQASADRDR
ncbi:MAG: hypothetical protein M1812_004316 [Candelaria pacifica]|nr:MAG: hypothetical protein M1812_004316 [Candelaria pacifica]